MNGHCVCYYTMNTIPFIIKSLCVQTLASHCRHCCEQVLKISIEFQSLATVVAINRSISTAPSSQYTSTMLSFLRLFICVKWTDFASSNQIYNILNRMACFQQKKSRGFFKQTVHLPPVSSTTETAHGQKSSIVFWSHFNT